MWEHAGNTVFSIVLIIIYAYFFGQYSVQKYFEKGVIILIHEENTLIPPPGTKYRTLKRRRVVKVLIRVQMCAMYP